MFGGNWGGYFWERSFVRCGLELEWAWMEGSETRSKMSEAWTIIVCAGCCPDPNCIFPLCRVEVVLVAVGAVGPV
jgi:hypothetical protein